MTIEIYNLSLVENAKAIPLHYYTKAQTPTGRKFKWMSKPTWTPTWHTMDFMVCWFWCHARLKEVDLAQNWETIIL